MQEVVTIKNQWLCSHVDIEYPTPLSLKGRDIYMAALLPCEYQICDMSSGSTFFEKDIFCADFHRMTVMFAVLQSQSYKTINEQEAVLEFLAQIMYSKPCDLYLGFHNGEPVASAIITHHHNVLLCSDIYVAKLYQDHTIDFAQGALQKWLEQHRLIGETLPTQFMIEVSSKRVISTSVR
jgi:hypothetical protein